MWTKPSIWTIWRYYSNSQHYLFVFVSVFGVFLVRILLIFLYSVRMRENIDSDFGLFLRSAPLFEVQRLFEPRRLLEEIRYVWKKIKPIKKF